MNKTTIEWVKNPDGTPGYTLNGMTGCRHHVNGLCAGGGFPCYAYRLANGRLKARYLANQILSNLAPVPGGFALHRLVKAREDPFYPRFWPERLRGIPQDWKTLAGQQRVKPKGIFLCDMGELFGPWVPREWQERIFDCIKANPQHRFYLLTKQPQELKGWSPFSPNCWVGVTATNQMFWNEALRHLTDVKASVKYVSIEPCLGQILPDPYTMQKAQLGWLIIGAQTKPYKPPTIAQVREIVEAADRAGVPVFLKDNLKPLLYGVIGLHAPYWADISSDNPSDWKLRQEMPSEHSLENVR